MKTKTFYANGKLLITGEYLVLQGALAFALPSVLGQEMQVETMSTEEHVTRRKINWRSNYKEDCWFEAEFSIPGLKIIDTSENKTASFLQTLLQEADRMNPAILKGHHSLSVETLLGFSPEWGLGSSSSLITNVADWFGIDPFTLFRNTQQGSGYDIACAKANGPIRYRLMLGSPVIEKVIFNPPFKDKLAFVYSGRKQNSAESVHEYLKINPRAENAKTRISQIGRDISSAQELNEFNALLDEHEEIMAGILGIPKIKEERFPDFPGSIKSLGAWGGDFFLASSEIGLNKIKSYFSHKSLHVILSFDELVL